MDSSFLSLLSQTCQLYLDDFDAELFIQKLDEYQDLSRQQYLTLKNQIDLIYKYTKNEKVLIIADKINQWELTNNALDNYKLINNQNSKNTGIAIVDEHGTFVMTDLVCRKILETQTPINIFDCFSNLSYQNIKNQKIIMKDLNHQMKFTIYSSRNRKKALKKFKNLRFRHNPIDSEFIYAKYLKTIDVEMNVISVQIDEKLKGNNLGIQINKSYFGRQFKGAVCYFKESINPEKFTVKQLAEDKQIQIWEGKLSIQIQEKWCQKKVKQEETKIED